MPGNRIRTSEIVNSRRAPEKPGAMAAMSSGVARTPINTSAAMINASRDATAPATRSASRASSFASSEEYTGMKDADSA